MPSEQMSELAHLEAELAAIATYIPTTIIRQQIADPVPGRVRGEFWYGTVLFADMSGFTALSGTLSALGKQGAEEISAIINRLFGTLVDEVLNHGGTLLKFGGDALTAFFDEADLGVEHARLGAAAALAMQVRMQEFANLATRSGTFSLRLRIGVHSGRVFAAQVGTTEHVELIVTGRAINRVAAAQEVAAPGAVVVSPETLVLLGPASIRSGLEGFVQLDALPYHPAPQPLKAHLDPAEFPDSTAYRRVIHAVIRALNPYLPHGLPRRFLEVQSSEIGEFRPVTILFANFHDFSALLEELETAPELAARVLDAYYRRAQAIVHRFGGIVNKVDMYTSGDKLMALFGAPIAYEDGPERALRAAIELRHALSEINHEIAEILGDQIGFQFGQKIGLNTGVVFAGQVGSRRRREYTVMGQPVNLSARLMSAAAPGQILVTASLRRVTEDAIAFSDLPPIALKGVSKPTEVAEAIQAREAITHSRQNATPLIGRGEELARLLAYSHAALAGKGGVATISGEAGVGKSRLLAEALELLREGLPNEAKPMLVSAECQSYDQRSPYALLRVLLLSMLKISQPEQIEVRSLVEAFAPQLARFTPLLGDILGIDLEETPLTRSLSPEQRRDRVSDLIEALFHGVAERQPLIVVVDDLQWIDASSFELLNRLIVNTADRALLLLLLYRPDPNLQFPWIGRADLYHLTIGELPRTSAQALAAALLGGDLPEALLPHLERAQGNPFFLEEVVYALVESGVLQRQTNNRWMLTRAIDASVLPDSIEGIITARLDRIDERSREVLQVCAVIGRRFTFPVLTVVSPRDELLEYLDHLVDTELLIVDDDERDLTHLFRHSLTHNVTYEAILYARRRDLHRQVADWIAKLYFDRLDDQLAVLARHYLLAEAWPEAFTFHMRAGRNAQSRYANREAIALFQSALEIAEQSAATPQACAEAHERLGDVLALIGEYASAIGHYEAALALHADLADQVRLHHQIARALGLSDRFDDALQTIQRGMSLPNATASPAYVSCLLLGAGIYGRLGKLAQAMQLAEQALEIAEHAESFADLARAYKLIGGIQRNLGDLRRSLEMLRQSMQRYQRSNDIVAIADAHNDLANTLFDLGELSEASEHYRVAAEMKQSIGDQYGEGMIACNLGELLRVRGQLDLAIVEYQRAIAIFSKLSSNYMLGVLTMNLGAVLIAQDALGEAERNLNESAQFFLQANAEDFLPELERYRAELALQADDLDAAQAAAERSISAARRNQARAEEGMTLRIVALIAAAQAQPAAAWEALQQALTILREAGNRHETARALIALARIAPSLNRAAEGAAAFAEALPILHEVAATRDLAEAEALSRQFGYPLLP